MSCGSVFDDFADDNGNIWFRKTRIGPPRWETEAEQKARLALSAAILLTLLGIAVSAFLVRKRHAESRKLFRFFASSVTFALIDILGSFEFPAMILLLAAFYTFLLHRCCVMRPSHQGAFRLIHICHMVFCGLLILFWLTIMALYLSTDVRLLYGYWNWETIQTAQLKVSFAYQVFYFVASLEVVAWCIFLIVVWRKDKSKKIMLLAFLLFGLPLFIQSIWDMAVSAAYFIPPFGTGGTVNFRVLTALWVFDDICTVCIYLGMLLAGAQLEKILEDEGNLDSESEMMAAADAERMRATATATVDEPTHEGMPYA
ncbi:MAG: hypothetical protein Q9190_004601, partial [Brigantiaea leucoxantha]